MRPKAIQFFPAIFAVILALWPAHTRGNSVAVTFPANTSFTAAQNFTFGWDFTLSSPVLVTDLGVFGAGELTDSHPITIWTSTGTVVTTGIVPAGTAGILVNQFRYVSIAPTLLAAGSYVIGAYYPTESEAIAFNAIGLTTAPEVSYGQGRVGAGTALPGNTVSNNGYFGPNFQFIAPAAVPEGGSSWILLALSLGGILGFRSVSKRRTA